MVTRLKNKIIKILKYTTLLDFLLGIFLLIILYNNLINLRYFPYQIRHQSLTPEDVVQSIFDVDYIKKKWFEEDVNDTRYDILRKAGNYDFFKSEKIKRDKMEYEEYNLALEKYRLDKENSYDPYTGEYINTGIEPPAQIDDDNFYKYIGNNYYKHVGFAIINKNTGSVITNEPYIENSVKGIDDVDKIKQIIQRGFKEHYDIKIYDNENDGEDFYKDTFGSNNEFVEIYIKSESAYVELSDLIKYSIKKIIGIITLILFLISKFLINIKQKKFREIIDANKIILHGLYVCLGINKLVLYIKAIIICFKRNKKYKNLLIIYLLLNFCVSAYFYFLLLHVDIVVIFLYMFIFISMAILFTNRVYSLMAVEGLKNISSGNIDYEMKEEYTKDINKVIRKINKITDAYGNAIEEKIKNEKLKTELISNVSHDLRTPLTSIINYVNILEDKSLTEDERKDYINIIARKSNRLKGLINDLFEISKLNSGGIVLEKIPIDLIEFIYQICGEYEDVLKENGLSIKVKSDFDSLILNLDGARMSRALENLMSNACKYSLAGTRVYIDIEDKGEQVVIAFRNISNYEMNFDNEEILENSIKGDKSRSLNPDGSGLGLAIAKTIVELHDGEVKIETEGDMFKLFILLNKGENYE